MSLKKTGRKIERNANLILYFNASFFIYKVKRASLSIIDYDSVSGFQQRKRWYRNSFTNQDWINLILHVIYKPAKLAHFKTKMTYMYFNEMLLQKENKSIREEA